MKYKVGQFVEIEGTDLAIVPEPYGKIIEVSELSEFPYLVRFKTRFAFHMKERTILRELTELESLVFFD